MHATLNLRPWLALLALLSTTPFAFAQDPAEAKITFEEHIKPIFREHCMACHHAADKSSGLALDTYAATLEGGSGGKIVAEGNVDGSRLWALMTHAAQPYMPPDQDKLPDPQLALVKKWIEQGMPENSGSAIKKPKANVAMIPKGAVGRPEGPPPLPESVLKQPMIYTPKSSAISALAASPWAPLIAIGGQEQVVLYHAENGLLLGILPFPEGEPQSIRFSRDGKLVLVGGGRHSHSGSAVLYNLATGDRVAKVGDELDIVLAADISDDNSKIALAGPLKLVKIFDTVTGEVKAELKKHTDWIYDVRFSPDGVLLASADRSNGLVVWEGDTGRLYLDLVGHKSEIRSLAWRQDSGALYSASLDGTVKMWEMTDGKLLKSWDAHPGGANAIAVSNDGTLVTTGKDNKLKVWDGAGNAAGEMPPLPDMGLEAAITVDSKYVAAGDWAGNVLLWERANPANQKSLQANPPTLQMLIASHQTLLAQAQQEATNTSSTMTAAQQQLEAMQLKMKAMEEALALTATELTAVTSENTQVRSEVDQTAKKMTELEAALAEMKKVQAEKSTLLAASDAKMQAMNAKKAELEQEKTAVATAMAPMADSFNAAKAAHDAAQAKLNQSKTAFDSASAELARFEQVRQDIAKKEAESKAQLEQITEQMKQLEAAATSDAANVTAMNETLAKLQQSLAQVQQQMADQEQQRKVAAEAMAAKQKTAAELRAKVEQLQAEAAAAAEKKAILEKAPK